MNELIRYFLESSIIFAVFYAVYYFWFVNDKNYQFSRFYLLTSSWFSIILPLLHIPVSITGSLENIFSIQETVQLPEVIVTTEGSSSTITGMNISWQFIIPGLYIIGVAYFLSRIIIENLYLIGFILKHRRKIIDDRNYKIIHTGGKIPTCSWFNYIFWNETEKLSQQETEQILRHEEAHILKKHSFDVLYIEILRAIFWPNPFIHGYKRAITALHEWQADDYVVQKSNVVDYIHLLARQILRSFNLQMSNHFSKSRTVRRINMLKSGKQRSVILKVILSLSISALLFYVFSCNVIDRRETSEIPELSAAINSQKNKDPMPNPNYQPNPEEEFFSNVDIQPEPEGGMEEFYQYVQENLTYPESAKKSGIQGKVFIEFVVMKDGSIEYVKVIEGIHKECDMVAMNIMENSPDWIPGYQAGMPVNVRMILPFSFKLNEKKNEEEINKSDKEMRI